MKNTGNIVNKIAKDALKGGQKIEINYSLPYIAINTGFEEYFFQGDEANNLIEEAQKSKLSNFCTVENIILWQAQGW